MLACELQNDRERFERLMTQHQSKVFGLAYRLCMDRQDAEDLTQEAFVRAFRSFHTYRSDRPFHNWMMRIVTRLFLDLRRVKARRPQTIPMMHSVVNEITGMSSQFEPVDPTHTPEQLVIEHSFSEPMLQALRKLKPTELAVIVMADIDELDQKEISDILGTPPTTVRSRLHRARKSLRKHLTEQALGHSVRPSQSSKALTA